MATSQLVTRSSRHAVMSSHGQLGMGRSKKRRDRRRDT